MELEQLVTYTNNSQIVRISGSVPSNCNSITFINIGTDTVTVMGYPIQSSYTLYLPGNIGELDITNYNVQFANVSTDQQLLVITKTY